MDKRKLDLAAVEAAVLGGAVLGGGGGGSMACGKLLGSQAVAKGAPELVHPADLPGDGIVVTAAMVGSPSGQVPYPTPEQFVRAVELLVPGPLAGIIANESGGTATANGWLQAAVLGIPVVDCPCNGRAHPTGMMGSLGLHRVLGYMSRQAAVGGDRAAGTYIELVVEAGLDAASATIRSASARVGGLVAAARNPVSVAYARDNGAPGAISQAIRLGETMLGARPSGPRAMIEAARAFLGGEVLAEGLVTRVELAQREGFDVGAVTVERSLGTGAAAEGGVGPSRPLELLFWNEYAVCERDGARLATFPDLIVTIDLETGLPVSTAEIAKGQRVAVLVVDRRKLILGAGMRDPDLLRPLEAAIGREIVSYVF